MVDSFIRLKIFIKKQNKEKTILPIDYFHFVYIKRWISFLFKYT